MFTAAVETTQRVALEQRQRIMVVDDNVDAAQMLSMFLEAAGHQLVVEHNPYAALERMRREIVDVFLLDIGLPGMDGYELAQRLRQQAGGAGATFIAVTGYGQEPDRNHSLDAGFSYHFVKPVDTVNLAKLLATLAGKVRNGRRERDAGFSEQALSA
jgi:CheY-like chemotaxis protein